jgi:hypothetical protein
MTSPCKRTAHEGCVGVGSGDAKKHPRIYSDPDLDYVAWWTREASAGLKRVATKKWRKNVIKRESVSTEQLPAPSFYQP